jgi:hypothetical protein
MKNKVHPTVLNVIKDEIVKQSGDYQNMDLNNRDDAVKKAVEKILKEK